MPYKVAMVGAGRMGGTHARHWDAMPDAQLMAVLDPHRDCANWPGSPRHFTDWETMIAEVKPDIVDICTPTPLHREYIERAAAQGVAIFSEKPLARTLADCDAIVDVIEKSGVPFMPGHVVRWFPEFATGKRIVDSGGIGKPATARTARMGVFPAAGTAAIWYSDYDQSGGVVLDLILHDFDWLRYCFGEVERVFAKGLFGRADLAGKLDYALVTLRFKSGVVGHVTGSWAHVSGFRTMYEIAGDSGIIDHDSVRSTPLTVARRASATNGTGDTVVVPRSPLEPKEDPYYQELNAFVQALKAGTPPPVTVYDAREAVRIAMAALESIQTGKVVTL